MRTRNQKRKVASKQTSPEQASGSRTRGTKRKISYRESPPTSSHESDNDGRDSSTHASSQTKVPKECLVHKKIKSTSKGAERIAVTKKHNRTSESKKTSLSQFQILPYLLLVEIFHYASQPLVDMANCRCSPSLNWLLRMALLCKGFADPALAVLYYAPQLMSVSQWTAFTKTLVLDPETTFTKYRPKIKYFGFDMGVSPFDLSFNTLLQFTSKLRGIGDPDWDLASRDGNMRCSYPIAAKRLCLLPGLLDGLQRFRLRLDSWNWNFILATRRGKLLHPWNSLEEIHRNDYFKYLKTLTLAEYSGIPEEMVLASALSALPNLKNLVIAIAEELSAGFWPALPHGLESLALSLTQIKAEELLSFLDRKGSHLRELSLRHNNALTMAFSLSLANSCPRLVTFFMDAQFLKGGPLSSRTALRILPTDEVPTWPATLQNLTLVNLTNLDYGIAQSLFQSLLDASSHLKDLRTIVVKAGVNIPHRERADFRHNWVKKIRGAYLRISEDPNPDFCSIQTAQASLLRPLESSSRKVPAKVTGPRRSTRQTGGSPSSSSSSPGSTDMDESKVFGQGLCNTVDIRIDNLRPTTSGKQFTEEDFLDSEASGDSDWDEDGQEHDDESHAW